MRSRPSRWACEPYDTAVAARLGSGLDVSPVLATVLTRRGLASVDEARALLAASERHDPFAMAGVRDAAELVLRHVERRSRIVVYGDYDVDGVCSTAMLVRTLRAFGAVPAWELPSRLGEGYGLSAAAVERFAGQGVELLVTVDCGVTAVGEVASARAAGIDVVVTDHHRPGECPPDCPLVHPALGGYPCPDLCAAGVVLKLSEALYALAGRDPVAAEQDVDLAALATVCDLVPLRGENRRIVREGLAAVARTSKPGLLALMRVAGVDPAEASEDALGFRLGPRLNAAGRMGRADAALELLMTEEEDRAEEVARELDGLNLDRQEEETRVLFAAEAACAEQASAGALVVAGEGWHPGVVGIVASRLVERHHRPCVVIALEGQVGRGSGRSIPAYDLRAGLAASAEHLRSFGGHRAAAGLEIDSKRVAAFREALARHAGAVLSPSDLLPKEPVDAVVPGGALGFELAEELERLRPFGPGNRQPTLLVPAARVEAVAAMGQGRQHARFTLATGGSRSHGVAFGSPPGALVAANERPHDLAVRLELNRWNGTVGPRVVLRALCPTAPGPLRVLGEEAPFWDRLERELGREVAPPPPAPTAAQLRDRRGAGFAGVVGDLLTSGETVLVAVAEVARRRSSLEALVAGLAPGGLAVASWRALAEAPELAAGFHHLVALDPPPWGAARGVPLRGGGDTVVHLAWGPADAEFALAVWRMELELRLALAEAYRALRDLHEPSAEALERALQGRGRYPRSPECCGRLVRVLRELGLIEYEPGGRGGPRCRILRSARTELDRSPSYRAYRERLASIERALAPELAARVTAAAASH